MEVDVTMQKDNQWEIHGDCRICRRKDYCSKPCTKNARLRNIALHHALNEYVSDKEKERKKEIRREKLRKLFRREK